MIDQPCLAYVFFCVNLYQIWGVISPVVFHEYVAIGVNDSITVSSAEELTSVSMRYSQGNGVHTPLS